MNNIQLYLIENNPFGFEIEVCAIENRSTLRSFVYVVNEEYFIKNAKFNDAHNLQLFKNEAWLLKYIHRNSNLLLSTHIPRFIFDDQYFPVIIIEYLKKATQPTINDIQEITAVVKFCHEIQANEIGLSRFMPWILDFNRENIYGIDLTAGNFLESILQAKLLYKHEVLCHGDLKSDNLLKANNIIYFADWELCGIGDGYWDICYLLASYAIAMIGTECAIIYDFEENQSEVLFFQLYKNQFKYVKTAFYALFEKVQAAKLKFLIFFGLSITQRLCESVKSETKNELFYYVFSIGRGLVTRPHHFLFLLD